MQPYFFPYVGYFQLISEVDKYILYDNLNYIKEGWVNKNRIMVAGQKETYISVPIDKKSSFKKIKDIEIDNSKPWKRKMLNAIFLNYKKAPYFDELFPTLEDIFQGEFRYLKDLNVTSIHQICRLLNIDQNLETAGDKYYAVEQIIDQKAQAVSSHKIEPKALRILEICAIENADTFINAIGGTQLYSKELFLSHNIDLKFLETLDHCYPQSSKGFTPNLSIIDVIMNCGLEHTREKILKAYKLV